MDTFLAFDFQQWAFGKNIPNEYKKLFGLMPIADEMNSI
jgi:hypothetical protein